MPGAISQEDPEYSACLSGAIISDEHDEENGLRSGPEQKSLQQIGEAKGVHTPPTKKLSVKKGVVNSLQK
jgi:hypothetical protein